MFAYLMLSLNRSVAYFLSCIILFPITLLSSEDELASKNLPSKISSYRFRFLTYDVTAVDARPVFSPDGKSVVFMRQPNNGDQAAPSTLYIVDASGNKNAEVFFNGINPLTQRPFNATRPDYSWTRRNYEVAFDALSDGIWLLDAATKRVKQVLTQEINSQSYTWSYPAWYPDGKSLSVTNYNNYGDALYHQLVKADARKLNRYGTLTNNQVVWVGESSVCQTKPSQLVFAGQQPVAQPPSTCTCPGGCTPDGYAQNCNQIWLQRGAQVSPIDNNQGRAPWFSPNGKYVVFESNRANPDNPDIYRLFVYSIKNQHIHVVTPPSINVQHAKWSPDGTKLAFAVNLINGAQGIAMVDLEP